MGNVTYLIGAGASCGAIPTVENIPVKLREYAGELTQLFPTGAYVGPEIMSDNQSKDLLNKYREAIFEVADKSGPPSTLDTYAKQLLLTHDSAKYLRLKGVLTSYLNYKQFKDPVDSRYDSFLASILGNDSTEFRGNINIVSWNYDFQFEKAYSRFYPGTDSQLLQNIMQVYPSINTSIHNFRIFKINGSVEFVERGEVSKKFMVNTFVNDADETKLARRAISLYNKIVEENAISNALFSFEKTSDEYKKNILGTVSNYLILSDALVVIGYSFPFFNRDTDRLLLKSINKKGLKVYIQDLKPERIEDSFLSIAPIEHNWMVKRISSCDQFFLPPEL